MLSLPLLINLLIKVLIYILNIDDIYTKFPPQKFKYHRKTEWVLYGTCDPPQWFEGWCTWRLCWRGEASGWCRGWTWDSADVGYSGPPYCTNHTGTSSRPSNTCHSCPSERHTYTGALWDTNRNHWSVFKWMLFGVTVFIKFSGLGWPIWQLSRAIDHKCIKTDEIMKLSTTVTLKRFCWAWEK